MPAFDEVFQVSRKNQQWKCVLQEETKSQHVFVTFKFKKFSMKEEIFMLVYSRMVGMTAGQPPLSVLHVENNSLTRAENTCMKEKEI